MTTVVHRDGFRITFTHPDSYEELKRVLSEIFAERIAVELSNLTQSSPFR